MMFIKQGEIMMEKTGYCYAADYSCICEECGKIFSGIACTDVRDGSDQSVLPAFLPNSINDMLGYAEARLAKKRLESNCRQKPYSDIRFTDDVCPHCGARQSWRLPEEPQKPSKPAGPIGLMIICAAFFGIIGMLVGLFVMIVAGTIGFIISIAFGVALGLCIGLIGHKEQRAQELEDYRKAMAAYPMYVREYEAFQRALARRKELHAPQVDLKSGRFMPANQLAETSQD
jgi:hypothetical protein